MKKPLTHIAQCLLCQAHSKHNTTRIVTHFIDHVHIAITFAGKARSRLATSISLLFFYPLALPP